MEKICVAVRVRPPVAEETSNVMHWKVEENRISLRRPLGTPISGVSFAFDHVFDENSTNARIYELLTKDIIHAAVDGFNGTAFAYGQTSSGKTFTMNGSESDPGIVHLAVKDIFHYIQMKTNREFLIRVSYMEIYNEEINDLFAPENQKLHIHESLERGIFVSGLREEIVNSAEQVLKLIEIGEVNRHVGQTNMNIRSSRSHTIFRMVIESRENNTASSDILNTDAIRVSVLNLVDLAGSERIAKTGAGGVRLKEGKHINKSLMVLGNVINKLSDGMKQRGHIPYRDSKLTRILQPALGGNAKTSIICTIAPEEVHIEETRGTLQFASRAKRVTNCAQVNEILTDAALLKRQQLEIEELRKKLEGSHSEVLEQDILKLRNEMLKYELEREKLEMELEEERKSHSERDQCIREQQMKIDSLNKLVTFSDQSVQSNSCGSSFTQRLSLESLDQGRVCFRQGHIEDCNGSHSKLDGDGFSSPCIKAIPNAFVMKRSDCSRLSESSPILDDFVNIADEDLWLKLNKGHHTDLDSLQITPERDYQSMLANDTLLGHPVESYKEEVQNLRRQLQHAIQEKNELEKSNMKQLSLNKQLMIELSELEQESLLIKEIPQRMCESVANCKDIYGDILSTMQSFAVDNSIPAKLLSITSSIGTHLFSTLETHFSRTFDDQKISVENSSMHEQVKVLSERLNAAVAALISPQALDARNMHLRKAQSRMEAEELAFGEESNFSWEKESKAEVLEATQRCQILERESILNNQLLVDSMERCLSLERECNLLKEEKASLVQSVSLSSEKVALLTAQNEEILKDLSTELQKRKYFEEEVQQFGLAFTRRQCLFKSFHSEFKAKIENLRASS